MTNAAGGSPASEEPYESGSVNEESSMAIAASLAAQSKGGTDIIVLDVSATLGICDYFVVVTATNSLMAKAIVDEIDRVMSQQFSCKPRSTEGASERRWILIDYGDIVVHVFMSEDRDYYRIERLYADAPRLEWAAE